MNINTTTKTYLAQYSDGYYANHQPHYEWSFTNDISKAKEYKSFKAALERATGYHKGIVREKITISETNGGVYTTSSTFKDYTHQECVDILKELNDIARDKKLQPILNKEKQIDDKIDASNKKLIAERKLYIGKQDSFYMPLFKELQETLNNDYYKAKRDKYVHSKDELLFDDTKLTIYSVFSNDDISKFRALYCLMNTVKILLDNDIHIALHGSVIVVGHDATRIKAKSILEEHGVFNDNEYCWFDKYEELCFKRV